MKNILFIFITLITIANVSYASFPVVESNLKILAIENDDDEDDGIKWGLLILFLSVLGFAAYFLFRTIWRAYRRDVPWVKKLLRWKNIWWLLLLIPVWFILNILAMGSGMGG
jgi:H+/Cl- antiporter ClcA